MKSLLVDFMAVALVDTDEGRSHHQIANAPNHEDNALTTFLQSNNLDDLCQLLLPSKLTINNLKQIDQSDLKMLCESLGFTIAQQIRLKQAIQKLQSPDSEEESKDEHKSSKRQLTEAERNKLDELQQVRFKAVFVGDSRVGKSSIMIQMIKKQFDQYKFPTIGATFLSHQVSAGTDRAAVVECWDTAGQEKYRSLAPLYYRRAYAVVIVYDITNMESFVIAQGWMDEVKKQEGDDVNFMLIGNKCDLEENRKVPVQEAMRWAVENSASFLETSAKHGTNIDALEKWFSTKGERFWEEHGEEQIQRKAKSVNLNKSVDQPADKRKRKKCC